MANTGRAYSDPTPGWVRGALRGGVDDPAVLVEDRWTPEQKKRWTTQFVAIRDSMRKSAEEARAARKAAEFEQDVAARDLAGKGLPVVRDVYAGMGQGAADLGSMALRAASVVSPPEAGQEPLADVANRKIEEDEKLRALAGAQRGPASVLQAATRGAARSVTQASAAAAVGLGPVGVIGSFAASRGNQAITEAKDAGLEGSKAAAYVGRAAAIEGGIAGAFQLVGAGGFEKIMAGGGFTKATVKEFLRDTVHELTEENLTEVADALNQAYSGVSGPVTGTQLKELLVQTTAQTILTMGAGRVISNVRGSAARDSMAAGLAERLGWTTRAARAAVDRAAEKGGDFEANMGHEVRNEEAHRPPALALWAAQNPDAARALVGKTNPSRQDWAAAGLPRSRDEDQRKAALGHIKAIVEVMDAMTPPAAPPSPAPAALAPPPNATPPPVDVPPPAPPSTLAGPPEVAPVGPGTAPPQDLGGYENAKGLDERLAAMSPAQRAQVEALRRRPVDMGVDFGSMPDQREAPRAFDLVEWVKANPDAARVLDSLTDPRAVDFEAAGTPVLDDEAMDRLRELLEPVDETPLVQPDERVTGAINRAFTEQGAGPPEAPPAPEEAPAAPRSAVDEARGRFERETAAIVPGSQDWRTADADTLASLLKDFRVQGDEDHRAATDRLAVLRNPIPAGADWRKADLALLRAMLSAKAIDAAELPEARRRLSELAQPELEKRLEEERERARALENKEESAPKPATQEPAKGSPSTGAAATAAQESAPPPKRTGRKNKAPPETAAKVPAKEAPPAVTAEGKSTGRKPASDAGPGPEAAAAPPSPAGSDAASPAEGPGPAEEKPKKRSKTEATLALAKVVEDELRAVGGRFDWRALQEWANDAYGGTLSEHAWEMQDAYEAVELGLSRAFAADASEEVGLGEAKSRVGSIGEGLRRVPTQTTRSDSKKELQQFSTPTDYAYAVTWLAAIRDGDVVLEPSAGTGNLAAHAKASGARVIANEWDKRRGALVATIADEVFNEDAKQIHDILPAKLQGGRPTIVVMNPPFSADKNRVGKKNLMEAAQHIEAGLAILPEGGRLVAIVGRGMAEDSATFAGWWDKIGGKYHVRANVEVSGKVYAKMGTEFETRVLVIDKLLPDTKGPVVTGAVETLPDLLNKLNEVRHDRPSVRAADRPKVGQAPARPGGTATGVGPGGAPAVDPDSGGKPAGDGGAAGAAEGVRGGQPAVDVGDRGGRVPAGGRPGGRSGKRAGRAADDAAGPSARGDAGEGAGLPAAAAAPVASLDVAAADRVAGEDQGTYEGYRPALKVKGAKPHPTPLVESAAMASVDAPSVGYKPMIDQKLIDDEVISEAQLEPVIFAGAAHEQMIPMSMEEKEQFRKLSGKDAPNEKRRGYFDGDGTGVGKGRIAAGVILDNWNRGRKKAVWISESQKLFKAAIRDWTAVGGQKNEVRGLHQVEAGAPVEHKQGILYTTYTTLGQPAPKSKEGEGPRLARIEQIVKWVGDDFDGVIVFDESHNAANAVEAKGARGIKKASNMALATVELQRRLPNARVLYMSATGATQVSNLAYADRLGLWGEGTEFANREAFLDSVASGGVAAMELVARDMKAQGMYLSRTLSFKGVRYSRLTHNLDPDQVRMYDDLCEAWQVVYKDIHKALSLTGPDGKADKKQKTQAMAQFWSTQQAFFNQVLTALQMPSVLAQLREDVASGFAPVIQIVNTMDAVAKRAKAKAMAEAEESGEEVDLADLDLTPRDALMEMVKNSFPVQKYETFTNEDGNTESRPVTDSEGNPVLNQEALAMREALLDKLREVRVPDAPIDQVINEFGWKRVAEVTGRKRRYVKKAGSHEREEQTRTTSGVLADIESFMGGDRDVLIFSQAGATGESYHADKTKKNQKPRRHYVLQAGWRADKAVQGLGRSHRSNQAHTPEFFLVETSLPGHRRFISTIAKRLEQLGALTRGQRTAGGGGLFSETDNLEGQHAQDSLYTLLMDIVAGKIDGVTAKDFEEQTGLKLVGDEASTSSIRSIEVKQFLNRMLSLKVDMQDKVFAAFSKRLELAIESARQNGTLDVGMETIRALRIEKVSEQTVRTDARSGAPTKHVELKAFFPMDRWKFQDVRDRAEKGPGGKEQIRFMRNTKSGRCYIFLPAGTTTEKGKMITLAARWGPAGRQIVDQTKVFSTHVDVTEAEARADWASALSLLPDEREERIHMITGALLPVWRSIPGRTRVRRATTTSGERFLGRVVEEEDIEEALGNLGVSRKVEKLDAKAAHDLIMAGGSIEFVNGWSIVRKRVRDENVFEMPATAFAYGDGNLIVGMGGRRSTDGNRVRYFLPTGEAFFPIYDRLVAGYQVKRINRPGNLERQLLPGDDDGPRPGGGGGLRVLAGGASTSAVGQAEARPVQAVEVTNKIRDLWPELTLRGPASFKRQFRVRRARGWYDPALGEARTAQAHDVLTAIHELGHHFDRELGSYSQHAGSRTIAAELRQLGEDLYGQRRPTGGYRAEGFAEFIREYLLGSDDLRTRAPATYAWFTTEHLLENPKDAARVAALAEVVQRFFSQGAQASIEALMSPTRTDWSGERLAASLRAFEADWRDSNLPLLRALQATGADLSRLEPRHHPYVLATYYARSAGGRTRHAALAQTVDLYGRENGKGLRDVLQPILDQGEETFQAWKEFMVAARALDRYHAHGKNPGISEADARAIFAKHQAKPHFESVAAAFTDFAHRALEPLVQAGAMTAKELADIIYWNPIYVPFMRRGEPGNAGSGGSGRAVNMVTAKGSNLPIHDPIEAMLLQYEKIQQVAMQTDVLRSMVQFYDDHKDGSEAPNLAKFLSEVPAEREAIVFSASEIRDAVAEAAGEDAEAVDEALDGFWKKKLTIFRPRKRTPNGGFGEDPVVAIVVRGKRRFFQVRPELEPILEGITQSQFLPGPVGAAVRGVTALQRLGATGLNPAFGLVRNALRDTLTASITGDYHFHLPVISTIRGVWKHLTNDEYARRYHAAGLDIAGQLGQDVQAARGLSRAMGAAPGLAAITAREGLAGAARNLRSRAWSATDALRQVLGVSELGPRLMEYEAAHEATLEKWGRGEAGQVNAAIIAGAASKDVTVNFARAGAQARKVNEVVLFFNAAIQSADKLLRSVGVAEAAPWASSQDRRRNAAVTLAKGAGFLTLSSMLLYLFQNKGDKEWEELPPHEKWGFLHIKIPGGSWVRIPMPFEAGAIFGALPVAMLEGPAAFREALGVALKSATPLDLDGLHGVMRNIALVSPIADVLANEDWKGAPIVPDTVGDNRLPADQFGPNASGLARLLGAHMPWGGMSPAKLEHLLNGYTGGLYKRMASAIDVAMDPSAVQPLDDPSTIPVAGTLFLRPGTSRVVGDFYDRLKHLRQRKGSKVATLEELGELALAERLNSDLQMVWSQRRDAIKSGEKASVVKEQTEALLKEAQDMIRRHNKRDKKLDRSTALGAALYRITAPEAKPEELPAGVTEAEAVAALRAEAERQHEARRRAGRRLEPLRMRENGKLTAFGQRQARLLRRFRGK